MLNRVDCNHAIELYISNTLSQTENSLQKFIAILNGMQVPEEEICSSILLAHCGKAIYKLVAVVMHSQSNQHQ